MTHYRMGWGNDAKTACGLNIWTTNTFDGQRRTAVDSSQLWFQVDCSECKKQSQS